MYMVDMDAKDRWNQNILSNGGDAPCRKAAVKNISNEESLMQIIRQVDMIGVIREAVERLHDQDNIRALAAAPETTAGEAACALLTDVQEQIRIISGIKEYFPRKNVLENVIEQETLEHFALNDPDAQVRRTATMRLNNVELLRRIQAEDMEKYVQRVAEDRIKELEKNR